VPIYEYRCTNCGNEREFLQKISDPPIVQCPNCGQSTFVKKVTAAGFQLKGTGWYVTDFRDKASRKGGETKSDEAGGTAKAGEAGESKSGESKSGDAKPAEAKPAADAGSKAAGGGESKGAATDSKPAPAGPGTGS